MRRKENDIIEASQKLSLRKNAQRQLELPPLLMKKGAILGL